MPAVSEAIAREFFEACGFFVRQPTKYLVIAREKRPEEEIDLFVFNPSPDPEVPVPSAAQVVGAADLKGIQRAVVCVRGWHSERVRATRPEHTADLTRFAEESALRRARSWWGTGPVCRILCIPELPATPTLRRKAVEVLAERGVDAVLLFPTMLLELIRRVDRNRNYEKSDLLQTLRILKVYGLLRDDQLELFRTPRVRHSEGESTT